MLATLLEEREDDMAFFAQRIDKGVLDRLQHVIDSPFERMSYTEAVRILEASGKSFEFPVAWGRDLQSEHERYLAEEHVGRPVVVVDYPAEIKAFYMRMNDDEKTVAAMDVLVPGVGKIIGGSQREERLDVLGARMAHTPELGEELWWYRDLRRYGTVPHAGFGLGLERLILYVTGMENILTPSLPRVPNAPRSESAAAGADKRRLPQYGLPRPLAPRPLARASKPLIGTALVLFFVARLPGGGTAVPS